MEVPALPLSLVKVLLRRLSSFFLGSLAGSLPHFKTRSLIPISLHHSPPDVLDPPEMLDYQVTFRYFTDFHAVNNPTLATDAAALEASWQRYLIDFKRRGVVTFFKEMKDQSWFKEKYEPSKEMTALRDRLKKKGREGGMQRFLNELEAGNLEAISYDYRTSLRSPLSRRSVELIPFLRQLAEGRKFSAEASTTTDGDVKMEDGDASAPVEAANGSPKLSRTSNPDLVTIEPNDRQLFIKTITPDVSREELEAVGLSSS